MIKFSNNTFHLSNENISYVINIMKNSQIGQLYFGKKIRHRDNFDHLAVERSVYLAPCAFEEDFDFSLELLKQEYPSYGTGDFREPSHQITSQNGSRITDFKYKSHEIFKGKNKLYGLPQTYGDDVETLEITMFDSILNVEMVLKYHLFENFSGIIRSVSFKNVSKDIVRINRAMSLCLDLYDSNFEMMTLDGAWARERHVTTRKIEKGVQSISSARGASSAMHNPFMALKRPDTTENRGEVFGFTLIYSGNFLAQAEVDAFDVTRAMIGINPFEFEWTLEQNEVFQTPEAVLVYSDNGLNGMSQNFHDLFRNNLIRGKYKNKTRPILINNWEATYFDFTEDSILQMAAKAKDVGIELFVLDDGWFGKRNSDETCLGDWNVNLEKLPNGINGLSKKINDLGLKFGLWFEPEMVSEVSNLYKTHPDFVIKTPNRPMSYGRSQFVLDFSRDDVVEYIFNKMCETIDNANISYIKWDMNRNITESFSLNLQADRQKEFFHRYILGVYKLYEKLIERFPEILFESCSAGGARFDAGMLYYAPQAWASDDTDAIERLHIQYGTSMLYPLSSIGSHVAAIPNHQVLRNTDIETRANVAYFGTFGYELNVNETDSADIKSMERQIEFFKKYREVFAFGDFYRLKSGNIYSWMVVSKDKKTAILGYYKILATPNPSLKKINLVGLCEEFEYTCNGKTYFGDELMNIGHIVETEFTGFVKTSAFNTKFNSGTDTGDFTSQIYVFEAL